MSVFVFVLHDCMSCVRLLYLPGGFGNVSHNLTFWLSCMDEIMLINLKGLTLLLFCTNEIMLCDVHGQQGHLAFETTCIPLRNFCRCYAFFRNDVIRLKNFVVTKLFRDDVHLFKEFYCH